MADIETSRSGEYRPRRRAAGLALLIGLVAFLVVVGPQVLDPNNPGWLSDGDARTHYLGWTFFRVDAWHWPLGRNPLYGLAFANSVVYSDSLPLFAIAFKVLSPVLPDTFQYFGGWLLICFALQAVFAWRLIGRYDDDPWVQGFGTALFVFAPPMLWRLHGHLSLVGHFLILAALCLVLEREAGRRSVAWSALLATCAAVHAYLLMMVLVLWLADMVEQLLDRRDDGALRLAALREIAIVAIIVGFVGWQCGYFEVGTSVVGDGFGLYRLNLLSLVNPMGWSQVLPAIPQGAGDYEGFNYLGLGTMVVALACLPAWPAARSVFRNVLRRRPALLACLFALTLFAITNHIGLGPFDLTIGMPWRVTRLADTFRASGRLFWPVYYVLTLTAIVVVVRTHARLVARTVLAVAALVQVVDTRTGWQPIHERIAETSSPRLLESPLHDAFWRDAMRRYGSIRLIIPNNEHANWSVFADLASRHGRGTDAAYLARVDERSLSQARVSARDAMASGDYDPSTLFVLDDDVVRAAAGLVKRDTDLIARVDGFVVIAPGWKTCGTCRQPRELQDDTIAPMRAVRRPAPRPLAGGDAP